MVAFAVVSYFDILFLVGW